MSDEDIQNVWSFYRDECLGGDGDYSYSYKYHIIFNGKDVLNFEVGVYEKNREEQPISIATIDNNSFSVKVEVKSFYDNFCYITKDGGKTWIFEKK